MMATSAKPKATPSMRKLAGCKVSDARPQDDENADEAERRRRRDGLCVIVSLRSGIASSATQAGVVNSSAKTVASGSSVRPKAHPSVPAKWSDVAREVQPEAPRLQAAAAAPA